MSDNGGPAFPIYTPDMNVAKDAGPGMSLRDYFAGQALAGIIGGSGEYLAAIGLSEAEAIPATARISYDMADAMLAERSREKP